MSSENGGDIDKSGICRVERHVSWIARGNPQPQAAATLCGKFIKQLIERQSIRRASPAESVKIGKTPYFAYYGTSLC